MCVCILCVPRDSCELSCYCWELSLGSLQEQQVLSTGEPSLQSLSLGFLIDLLRTVIELDFLGHKL